MKKTVYAILTATLLMACNSTMNMMESEWSKPAYTARRFDRIAVLVVSDDNALRQQVESTLAQELIKEGHEAISGAQLVPLKGKAADWDEKRIAKNLEAKAIDGLLVMSLVRARDKRVFNSGETYTYPNGYARAGRFIFRTYGYVTTPNYYTTETEYLVEADLYDLEEANDKDRALVWSGQSAISDYGSAKRTANTYGKRLLHYLKDKGLLRDTRPHGHAFWGQKELVAIMEIE